MLNVSPHTLCRSSNVAARGRAAVDRRPGARAQPPPGGHGALPHEREGALPHDHGHVLPAGAARRKDALQGLQHQALHGHVQQQRRMRRGGLLDEEDQEHHIARFSGRHSSPANGCDKINERTEDSGSDMKMKKPPGREKPKNKLTLGNYGIIHNEESHLTDQQRSLQCICSGSTCSLPHWGVLRRNEQLSI